MGHREQGQRYAGNSKRLPIDEAGADPNFDTQSVEDVFRAHRGFPGVHGQYGLRSSESAQPVVHHS